MERAEVAKKPLSSADWASVGRNGPLRDQKSPGFVNVLGRRGLLPVSGDPDQRIAAIARLQRGRVTRQQLLAAGLAPTTIKNLLRRRLLHAEHAGVYAVACVPAVPLAHETSALLACHGNAVLSHLSAAALWGLIVSPAGPVDVTVAGADTGRKRAGLRVHRTAVLSRHDTATHRGLPVTSAARTLLDLSACSPVRVLERALDEALVVLEIVRRQHLEDALDRAGIRPGTRLLSDLLSQRSGSTLTESEAEERFLALIRKADLPTPETQVPFDGFRIDFLWRDLGVVFEVDGYRYHSSRSAFNRDRRKDAVLKSAGLDPNHVTRDEVEYRPFTVIALVAGALARAAAIGSAHSLR